MTDEQKKQALRDVLFDPMAPVGIAYDLAPGRLTVTVYVSDPAPPGTRILASITMPDTDAGALAVGVRAFPLMAFFPEEKARIEELFKVSHVDPGGS